MSFINAILVAFGIIVTYFMFFFVGGTRTKNNSVVDMGWGLGFVIPTVVLYFFTSQTDPQFILLFLVSFWGLRLTYYLVKRNLGKPEDFRYKLWRRQWGKNAISKAFIRVYLLQAVIMAVVSLPVVTMMNETSNDVALNLWSLAALAIYFIGIFFEAVGDSQLKEHRKIAPGELLTSGVWSLTRHPNYFGNSAIWFGITLFVIIHQPSLWWTLVSPLLMTYILVFISTPMVERRMQKKAGWAEYKSSTNMFLPWFKKEKI